MSKIKIETMGCYQQVVDVIGTEKAKVELFKAMESYIKPEDEDYWDVSNELTGAFYWTNTIQGHHFWNYIDRKDTPYEN